MQIFRHAQNLQNKFLKGHLAIGNFDGVHKGHQFVIKQAIANAKKDGKPAGILTFTPHPRRFFAPDAEPFALTPYRTKMRMFEQLGLDYIFLASFNAALAEMDAEEFVTEFLCRRLDVRRVYVGEGFSFGRKASGNTALLQQLGTKLGFEVSTVKLQTDTSGQTCSSTAVRNALRHGEIAVANTILGRRYEMEGRVEKGYQRGRELGFATANVPMGEYIRPKLGVYAVLAGIDNGHETLWHKAIANIGKRPTFNLENTLAEVHLLNHSENLYSKHLRIAFEQFIRPEHKFDSIEALKKQIEKDCNTARTQLSSIKDF